MIYVEAILKSQGFILPVGVKIEEFKIGKNIEFRLFTRRLNTGDFVKIYLTTDVRNFVRASFNKEEPKEFTFLIYVEIKETILKKIKDKYGIAEIQVCKGTIKEMERGSEIGYFSNYTYYILKGLVLYTKLKLVRDRENVINSIKKYLKKASKYGEDKEIKWILQKLETIK